ncbi:MAG: bifunctional [glutamine synthetase] adenylyltransferase/[glutamine synthetase]-adenylyl-L-tyrosine phosphorylase [Acidimicrobiales bacterium]
MVRAGTALRIADMTLQPEVEATAAGAAAPEAVRLAFERLAESGAGESLEADEPLRNLVSQVVSASRSLTRVILTDVAALEVLRHVAARTGPETGLPATADASVASDTPDLVRRKRLGLLAIAAADLSGQASLEETGSALSALADGVLAAACSIAGVGGELAVIAMGKLGACELNYASDVDIMFVGQDGGSTARRVLAAAGAAFRVDTDLRPEGRNGALVRSLDSFRAYWARWAKPWEFQALLKARASAGGAAIGAAFVEASREAIWGRAFGADDLAELRLMKGRSEQIVERRGLEAREIKRGRGGIRDVEFSVQLLQLVHGAADEAIRTPATLPALAELAAAGYIDKGDAAALALSYRFLRTVEHRLQLVEEAQVHTVPAELEARRALARVLGFAGERNGRGQRAPREPEERLAVVLQRYQSSARAIHERLFFRPLMEVFARGQKPAGPGAGARWTIEAAESRLAALGFRQADRTRQAIDELTRGLTRSSRLMQQLLPVLLGWLSEAADPDQGLLALRTLVSVPHRRDVLVAAWRESPELARRLSVLLGTSRQVGELVGRYPELAASLGDDAESSPLTAEELRQRAVIACESGRAAPALRHVVESAMLRVITDDVLRDAPPDRTGRCLADLGDAVVTAALHAASPAVPMGVVALGRLGGRELSYGSDLDVLVVYDGTGAGHAALAEQAAVALFRLLNGATPAERIWTADASLRPWGRQGPLARSLHAYGEYYERWGETWERQALLRARPIAGDPGVLERFMSIAGEAVWGRQFGAAETRAIRQMKARTERERIPSGEDPQFHFKLGKGSLADVEWTAQLLQLQHGVRATSTPTALGLLAAEGHLEGPEATILGEAYRFLNKTRNRWHLVGNFVAGAGHVVSPIGSDSLPADREALARLARSLGTDATELREAYRRVTRRARRVVEGHFYGL